MKVVFRRTGERRYATYVERPGQAPEGFDPAPGYDESIPHDLVHYLVEAELGLGSGVFGRAASGGGTFFVASNSAGSARERARNERKRKKREQSLARADVGGEMALSERLAGRVDLAWRRRHGQRPDPALWKPEEKPSAEDERRVARVVTRLDAVAPVWRALAVGGELVFEWPAVVPTTPVGPPELGTAGFSNVTESRDLS